MEKLYIYYQNKEKELTKKSNLARLEYGSFFNHYCDPINNEDYYVSLELNSYIKDDILYGIEYYDSKQIEEHESDLIDMYSLYITTFDDFPKMLMLDPTFAYYLDKDFYFKYTDFFTNEAYFFNDSFELYKTNKSIGNKTDSFVTFKNKVLVKEFLLREKVGERKFSILKEMFKNADDNYIKRDEIILNQNYIFESYLVLSDEYKRENLNEILIDGKEIIEYLKNIHTDLSFFKMYEKDLFTDYYIVSTYKENIMEKLEEGGSLTITEKDSKKLKEHVNNLTTCKKEINKPIDSSLINFYKSIENDELRITSDEMPNVVKGKKSFLNMIDDFFSTYDYIKANDSGLRKEYNFFNCFNVYLYFYNDYIIDETDLKILKSIGEKVYNKLYSKDISLVYFK